MAQTASPFLLKDTSLTLVKQGEVTTPVEFRCQLSQAQLTPSAGSTGGGATLETFCASYSDAGADSTWTLDLAGFQAYADATDFALLAFTEEGEKFDFTLLPSGGTAGPTNPGFEGVVTMSPVAIGGTANQYATFTVSLSVEGKPTVISALAATASVGAGDE